MIGKFLIFEQSSFYGRPSRKISFNPKLADFKDIEILQKIISLKKSKEEDWWSELNAEERSEIEIGIDQADKGEVISHSDAMAKYKKWL